MNKMPKKKKQVRNGFFWYMQDLIPELRREGHQINGIAVAVPLAHPRWKALSPEDKEIYEERARVEKRKESAKTAISTGQNVRDTRRDNVGQLIACRVSPEEVALKRRAKESRITKSRWPTGDKALEEMLDFQFYFIAFEYLCEMEVNEVKSYFPMEVGAVEYTMRHGITKTFHRHIKPADVPLGYRYECMHHSDGTHQIPIGGHEEADSNYMGLYIQLENFINQSGKKKEYPAMFALGAHLDCVESSLQWIHKMACHMGLGHPSRLQKVFELENMVVDLVQFAGEAAISRAPILDILSSCTWDYEANTRCDFHEEMGNKFCALYSVRNWVYLLSDFLADIYKFDLIPGKHQPEPGDSDVVTIPPMPHVERRPVPQKSSNSYSSMVHDGGHPFGGRDIRQDQEKFVINTGDSDGDSDSDTDFDSVLEMELANPGLKENSNMNHNMAGLGRGKMLPPGGGGSLGIGRGAPAPPVDDDDEFPALGAPGPAKPRQRQPAPSQRYPQYPGGSQPSLASSIVSSSVRTSASVSSKVSVTSSQYDSDEEDVLSRPPTRIKTLHEAVREKEMAQKMRTQKPAVSTLSEPTIRNLSISTGPQSAGLGNGPRTVNVSSGFKPSLGNVSVTANVGQGRGALFSSSSGMLPVGRGRGRGGPPSVASFASSQDSRDSRSVPRAVNANPAWGGVGRGFGVPQAPSEASSAFSGFTTPSFMKYSAVADDNESLASSSTSFSNMSSVGRGRGMWTAKKTPVQPPPGFGLGKTLADRMQQGLNLTDNQFQDSQGS